MKSIEDPDFGRFRTQGTVAVGVFTCQHRLKIPHCAGRKFLHPELVYDCSRLIDDETGW
jgi:hypothetical protein